LPWFNSAHHSGLGRVVHHSKIGGRLAAMGLGCAKTKSNWS
jgi:hypothetical protein